METRTMNSKPPSSSSAITRDMKDDHKIISKLRRLKIEENLLLQSIQIYDHKLGYEDNESNLNNDLDFKTTLKKVKDSFINIKNSFDEVKIVTCSQELLAELEIDEYKKKVFDFETTLKSFKLYLGNENSSLKITEQEILNQIDVINIREIKINKNRPKISSTNFNQTVPSPVRLIMTSPFKCTEVQEFQDFMKNSPNSPNRYGGWNEYHHNIFVKYWQKYFGNSSNTDIIDSDAADLASENFIEEALLKLEGINKENLMSHIAWYKKYVYLKDKQQRAIDKWKSKRTSMRNVSDQVRTRNSRQERGENIVQIDTADNDVDLVGPNDFNQIACNVFDKPDEARIYDSTSKFTYLKLKKTILSKETKPSRKKISHHDIQRLMKPTKQWLSRNYGWEQSKQQSNFIENLEKLRVPSWRQYL